MTKQTLRFKAKIEGQEVGVVAAIAPPVDVPAFFGTRGRVPVRGTINGYPYRSSLSPCVGRHRMPVNKLLRAGAGAEPDDMVDVGDGAGRRGTHGGSAAGVEEGAG